MGITELFNEISSADFINFKFHSLNYADQLKKSTEKSGKTCGVSVYIVSNENASYVLIKHCFAFMGGSLGCAEGEKICKACDYVIEKKLPLVIDSASGGARMQEGAYSLMQMSRTVSFINKVKQAGIPIISIFRDPCYGGVSASYAFQADIRLSFKGCRIGFAGPQVIINTMFNGDQKELDKNCPPGFQTADRLLKRGYIDYLFEENASDDEVKNVIEILCSSFLSQFKNSNNVNNDIKCFCVPSPNSSSTSNLDTTTSDDTFKDLAKKNIMAVDTESPPLTHSNINDEKDKFYFRDVRKPSLPQADDYAENIFKRFSMKSQFVKLYGDDCIVPYVGTFNLNTTNDEKKDKYVPCVIIATRRGKDAELLKSDANMGTAAGYRKAKRIVQSLSRCNYHIYSIVDTAGASPSMQCEDECQAEAVSECLAIWQECKTPNSCVIIGEGGSGGALAFAGCNSVGMLNRSFYGVITPEGAASILGKSVYGDTIEGSKIAKQNFKDDCNLLADVQGVYSNSLLKLGVVDKIIEVIYDSNKKYDIDRISLAIADFFKTTSNHFSVLSTDEIINDRRARFNKFSNVSLIQNANQTDNNDIYLGNNLRKSNGKGNKKLEERITKAKNNNESDLSLWEQIGNLLKFLSEKTLLNSNSFIENETMATVADKLTGINISLPNWNNDVFADLMKNSTVNSNSIRGILLNKGPKAVCEKVLKATQNKPYSCMYTDTSMRDAHQSILATRIRTREIMQAGTIIRENNLDEDPRLFSLEAWGGATYDTTMRFLDEDPFTRLRLLRKLMPNTLIQMLGRGMNVVGYTNYDEQTVREFVMASYYAGVDVFRVFDAFNDLNQVDAVVTSVLEKTKMLCEVCICFSGNFLDENEKIYTLKYYEDLTKDIIKRWPDVHIICIKDMAGLVTPDMAKPLLETINKVTNYSKPIHFHTHDTSGSSIATCREMAKYGCNIIDAASCSMANTTSQPPLQTLMRINNQAIESLSQLVETSFNIDKDNDKISSTHKKYSKGWQDYDSLWRRIRSTYVGILDSGTGAIRGSSDFVYSHQMPGGQVSNLYQQCASMGLESKWEECMQLYADANEILLGNIIKVTPSSKVVGDLALFMVANSISIKDALNPDIAKKIDWPASVQNLFNGKLGVPHHGGFNLYFMQGVLRLSSIEEAKIKLEGLLKIRHTLKTSEPSENVSEEKFLETLHKSENYKKVLNILDAEDLRKCYEYSFNAFRTKVSEKDGLIIKMEDYIPTKDELINDDFLKYTNYLMYPKVYPDYLKRREKYGDLCFMVPLQTFLRGCKIGNIISLMPFANISVRLDRISPADFDESKKVCFWSVSVNDSEFIESIEIPVNITKEKSQTAILMAKEDCAEDIGAAVPGIIEKILAKNGEIVKQGQVLMSIASSKLELEITAHRNGTVKLFASEGLKVAPGTLLCKVEN